MGLEVELNEKEKAAKTGIVSAFLKNNSTVYDLKVMGKRVIKIKFEVDTDPPLRFSCRRICSINRTRSTSSVLRCPICSPGKTHALLYRQWQNRVKGRDWFDSNT